MSRISIKSKADLPQELWPLWEKMQGYGAFENQAGVMAHRPPIFRNTWAMLTELAEEGVLPKRYLELCLVTVSLLNKCTYCVSHHAPKLAVAGISEAGAAGLLDYKAIPSSTRSTSWSWSTRLPSPTAGTARATRCSRGSRQHFTEAQIVELTWRTALCGAFNRFNDILQLDIEEGVAVREAAE